MLFRSGVSHFRPLADNLRLSWMHARMCTAFSTRWCLRAMGLLRA